MTDFELPITRYALSGDVSIAYQIMGNGPIDLIIVPGLVSHIEFAHESPGYTAFARVITFDKRGQGSSDRISDVPSLEIRMDDVRAVMDAVGSKQAAIMGFSEGCAMSALFAATYPERVSKLLLFGGFAVPTMLLDNIQKVVAERVKLWGTGVMIKTSCPSQADCKV
jgi:pimeloyl-ACP methyl ester carboxylesterase